MKLAKGLFPFLFLSILFHSVFLIYKHRERLAYHRTSSKNEHVRVTKIKFEKKKDEAIKAPDSKKLQIVESEKEENNDRPKEKFFLSEKDQTVSRQTVAKNVDKFNQGGQGKSANPSQIPANQAKAEVRKPQKGVKDLKLSDLAVAPLEIAERVKKPTAEAKTADSQYGAGKGVSSSNDFVEEIPIGDFTKMNTVQYKHFGFYQRIKHKLEQYWGATLREKAEKIFHQGRKLAQENYITSLIIEMDELGNIVQVHVKGSSGVSELDDAAIESFNKAGPFPNPPKDLLHAGKAKIEWGFVVKS